MHTSPWHWSIILTLLLLLLRGQTLLAAERANDQAVKTVFFCVEGRATLPADATMPGFNAIAARCQGDEARQEEAWRQLLLASGARLDVARAARPQDAGLARLAAAQHPEMAIAHFWLGDALREEGNAKAASAAYEAGLALDPTAALIWDHVGRLYQDGGDLEKAVQAFDQACYHVDRGKNGCLRAAGLYLQWDMYEEAANRYRTSLQQLPGYGPAHRGIAEALLALGRTEEALPHLQALADRDDEQAQQTLRELTQ